MSQHTPGPWHAQSGEDFTSEGTGGVWIVTTVDDDPSTFQCVAECNFDRPEANARLIACAPELLAFVNEVLPFLFNSPLEGSIVMFDKGQALRDKAESRKPVSLQEETP